MGELGQRLEEPDAQASDVDAANLVLIPDDDEEEAAEAIAHPTHFKFSWKRLWAFTGPGWLMSMAYLDPGNLESDLQAGAYTGYQLVWVLFISILMGLLLQVLAARLGVVTGKNLAEVCRANYPYPITIALWLMTEIAIIGSDIQEVLGSAIALKILMGLPLWAGCLLTGFDTFTFMLLHFYGVRKLEALFAVLILVMVVCFYVNWARIGVDMSAMMEGWWVPVQSFEHDYATVQAVGILGAVIMPHNLYLHSALVQSRKVDRSHHHKVAEANYYNVIESAVALFVAFVINLAVVAVFSESFFDSGCAESGFNDHNLNLACVDGSLGEYKDRTLYPPSPSCAKQFEQANCAEIGLAVAGGVLSSTLKSTGKYFWAVGLLAAGQASTMTGTFAGQYVMEGFLDIKLPAWKRVMVTRTIALGPAVAVALSTAHNASLSDRLGEWLNVLQSVQLPFAILPLLVFTSSGTVMGQFKNGRVTKLTVWLLGAVVMATNLYLIYSFMLDSDSPVPHKAWFYTVVGVLFVLYISLIAYLLKASILNLYKAVCVVCGKGDDGSKSEGEDAKSYALWR